MANNKLLNIEKIQNDLYSKMLNVFSSIADEREDYYLRNPDELPTESDVGRIIASYGYQNAAISGAVSLVPGPLGMAAAIPEIMLIVRNQVRMIYDIGVAKGRKETISKEILVGIYTDSFDVEKIGLLSEKNGNVFIKRTSLNVFHEIIAFMAGRITQQLTKSMISKWVPVIGAIAMSVWSKYSTQLIGVKAKEIFGKNIEILEDHQGIVIEITAEQKAHIDEELLTRLRIVSLCNLMKVDGIIRDVEKKYIETMIANSGLDKDTQMKLQAEMAAPGLADIDYHPFPEDYIETTGLLIDLVALAKRDGEFHNAEKNYIKEVGRKLGISDEKIEAIMDI